MHGKYLLNKAGIWSRTRRSGISKAPAEHNACGRRGHVPWGPCDAARLQGHARGLRRCVCQFYGATVRQMGTELLCLCRWCTCPQSSRRRRSVDWQIKKKKNIMKLIHASTLSATWPGTSLQVMAILNPHTDFQLREEFVAAHWHHDRTGRRLKLQHGSKVFFRLAFRHPRTIVLARRSFGHVLRCV